MRKCYHPVQGTEKWRTYERIVRGQLKVKKNRKKGKEREGFGENGWLLEQCPPSNSDVNIGYSFISLNNNYLSICHIKLSVC